MRRLICFILILALFLAGGSASAENAAEGSVQLPTKAQVLMEAETGQILYSMNPDAKLPMASVTKVMSLLLWAEEIEAGRLTLEEKVTASSYASSAEGSVIWLEAGEEMTAAELLEAVIVSSANDACIALAEHTAGSEAAFVKRMNSRAAELGMKNTRYTGCVGFDAQGHYSTAKDIAIVTAELMKHEVYRGWFLTWMDYLRGGNTQLVNTNKLVRYYDGILGGKTGTTDGAGCCLSVCAERGDMRLIAVVLGCEDDDIRFDEAEQLLDHGFSSFERFSPEVDMTQMKPIPVKRGAAKQADIRVEQLGAECIIRKGRSGDVEYEYTFVESVDAPVEKGQFMGEYLVTLDGVEVFRSDIVAQDDISRMSFPLSLWYILAELVTM